MFKTVLFPIDRSRETQEAVGVVVEIVQKYGSRLILLSVVEGSEEADEGMESPDVVARLLEDAQSVFKQQGIQTEAFERQGKPAFVICDVADEVSANLIVMGCRGLGLTEEGVTESVTNRVINLSPCPVLVVP
ncbi:MULTISPECIES: universal stress protein [Cyanophyceae]|jgi:nucleotide-binding universal stress UspA family protein|uniref:UspA domain-containing protein n=2 Tax=Cyanophyceae TaxID=3028117 RepID=K9TW41_CHRTP|nr:MULTISPECIES: universal stress protein [Cyanophyceae]AFY86623.1 UspA domain-containing protein [Chroococcidiopsis thermalis PCC 7203]MBE9015850.1 universal stress protein [Chroococcidiopsidales cyanobacterium LEGE 13417]NHC34451.1 universal stress protein [Scytonema millei VB511283]PSM50464.1 universal stress protein [Chroococcidiopsis sp. CCALA 051]